MKMKKKIVQPVKNAVSQKNKMKNQETKKIVESYVANSTSCEEKANENEVNAVAQEQVVNLADEYNKLMQYGIKISNNFTEGSLYNCSMLTESTLESTKLFGCSMFEFCDQLFYISVETAKKFMGCKDMDDMMSLQKQMMGQVMGATKNISGGLSDISTKQLKTIAKMTDKC